MTHIQHIVTIVSVHFKHYTRFDTMCLWRFSLNTGRLQAVRKVIGNAFQIWVPEYWKLFLNNSVLCFGVAILLLSPERKLWYSEYWKLNKSEIYDGDKLFTDLYRRIALLYFTLSNTVSQPNSSKRGFDDASGGESRITRGYLLKFMYSFNV